jgi:3-deoxy-D-manno-octulosonic-acid transferase
MEAKVNLPLKGDAAPIYLLYNTLLLLATVGGLPLLLGLIALKKKHRIGLAQKLGYWPKEVFEALGSTRPLWYHAVSVGEVIASIPLLQRIRREFPGIPILFSTVTATGNATALSKIKDMDQLVYFPLDHPWVVQRVLQKVVPRLFITTETEIWPNFMRFLGKRGIPIALVNGRISPRSFRRYRPFRFFFTKVLQNVSVFCMQSPLNAQRIEKIGADPMRILVTGNIKFDLNIPDSAHIEEVKRQLGLDKGQAVFVAGSTHRGEEELVLNVFGKLKREFSGLRLIVAPRSPERFLEVEGIIKQDFTSFKRRTLIAHHERDNPPDVILLDTIGELKEIYGLSSLVFLGGSLVPVGGHNPLEAVAYKKPVLFGPHMFNFAEISKALRDSGGGIQVDGEEDFYQKCRDLLKNPDLRMNLGESAFKILEIHSGAVDKHMTALAPFLSQR